MNTKDLINQTAAPLSGEILDTIPGGNHQHQQCYHQSPCIQHQQVNDLQINRHIFK